MERYGTIEVAITAGVASIELNRPDVRNAFNTEMIAELTDACGVISDMPDVRAVVLSGNGQSFSAGADVNWMRSSLEFMPDENIADAWKMSDMFAAIDNLPQPVVARVHGAALGGGMGLIACSDIVVTAESTVFGFTETKLGIIPAVITRFVLPKIGSSWARALFMTGERFGPELARQMGLVHWIVDADDLNETVAEKVRELLSSGPLAVRSAKSLVKDVTGLSDLQVREHTAARIAELRASPEGQEGLRAFLEKRRPAWEPEDHA